ncbi:hypothetical protein J2N86_11670 [Legionella lytica]|uniref:Uncharacterized protein n=1 Tax=Legionella lytica TaxID=96232 RepID=A0ABY4Y760_9GAMM|nr:hypothetical protein [Legionella lytica]USQ13336.1 hypothetical protein J2N86_11670 [Legionella lytica]
MQSLFCKAMANTGIMVASTTIAQVTYSGAHSLSNLIQNRYVLWQRALPICSESNSSKKEAKDVNIVTP